MIARAIIAAGSRDTSPVGPTPSHAVSILGGQNTSTYMSRTIGAVASQQDLVISYWVRLENIADELSTYAVCVDIESGSLGDYVVYDRFFRTASGQILCAREYHASSGKGYNDISPFPIATTDWLHMYHVYNYAVGDVRSYVNGQQIPNAEAFVPGTNSAWGQSGKVHWLGRATTGGVTRRFDGYFYDMYWLFGVTEAQAPISAFAEDVTGTWSAKKYGGPFPAGSFNLDFEDDGNSNANLGNDVSGNGNHFTIPAPGLPYVTQITTVPPRVDA